MIRFPFVAFVVAAAAAAQDHYIPLGFASAAGPPAASYSVMRAKDQNQDGRIQNSELSAFLTTCFHTSGGTCFMTDAQAVVENGEVAFYFTDSEQGRVIRGVDLDHDGQLSAGEVTEFFFFGIRTSPATAVNLLAPDTLAVYRDQANNRTIVYVGLDNTAPSTLGFTHGIYRLVDLDGNGDAKGVGESSLFAATSMGMQVPGTSGPVTVNVDFIRLLRVLPGGKLVAFAQGRAVNPATPTIQPDQNVFYGFTDSNGTATAEVWFNSSTLNALPRHPDFANGTFPNWDTYDPSTVPPTQNCFARFVAVSPHGFLGLPVYYIGSSYGVSDPTDFNVNGQHIAGLVYRVLDLNNNQVIDPGELTLWANISGTTYNGVAPVTYTNILSSLPVSTIDRRWWGMSATDDGAVSFTYDSGSVHTAVVSMHDNNFDGMIDNSEIAMTWVDDVHPFPLNSTLGGFYDDFMSLQDGTMPGPFPTGVTTVGDGCTAPGRGLKPVMDVWNGGPRVGNTAFRLGPIRLVPSALAFVLADFSAAPSPVPLGPLGLSPACFSYLQSPVTLALLLADANGRAQLPVAIPNNAGLAGLSLFFQAAAFDPTSTQPLPFYTTNALHLVVQP
jgi:hypothetical protein